MTFDMDNLMRRPLIDKQTSYVDDISESAEGSFINSCSDDPLEEVLRTGEEKSFSIDSRAEEYTRLRDASMEPASVDEIEDDASEINIDRYLLNYVDRQPTFSKEWDPEKHRRLS